ncbi:MAG: zinc ribbon domain-containing protein [Spirochaetaceae bacterium]|jgi:putative FmdB family regulatory protein|nr:zinc ribbon domain-containing protein [Spirochaetaceae bacterium]
MPTYEYECKKCAHTFEAFQSMKDPPLDTCPQCGSQVRRLINGGGGVIFKGSGFYATDKKAGGAPAPKPAAADSPCACCKDASCAKSEASGGNGAEKRAAG